MKYFNFLAFFISSIWTITSFGSTSIYIAEIVKLKGSVSQLSPGAHQARYLSAGDKLVEDTSVLTGPKSFAKIKLLDDSEITIGPESKIILTDLKKNSPGIISLLKGRIRSEIKKDSSIGNQNKFFIKTRTAALGVRGTDFQTIYTPENKVTSLLTFSGEVAFSKFTEAERAKLESSDLQEVQRNEISKTINIKKIPAKKLDEIQQLNKILQSHETVLVPPGQNSIISDNLRRASLPVKISPIQFDVLYKNKSFDSKAVADVKEVGDFDFSKVQVSAAEQKSPAEGFYNSESGEFAPKSGGFVDLNTGLYIAPTKESEFDPKSGVFVSKKIGSIDEETGQYIPPKGLILDAYKGFVASDDIKSPEIISLRQDLNESISKNLVVNATSTEIEKSFDLNEKFIRNKISFAFSGNNQKIKLNSGLDHSIFANIDTSKALNWSLDWQFSSLSRFAPIFGIEYKDFDFTKNNNQISQISTKSLNANMGFLYSLNENFNLFSKIGLYQEQFLNQVSVAYPVNYSLEKIVISRIDFGSSFELWKDRKISFDGKFSGLFSFRKRINSFVVNEGAGLSFSLLPKYKWDSKKWIGLAFKYENQSQKFRNSFIENRENRQTRGVELNSSLEF